MNPRSAAVLGDIKPVLISSRIKNAVFIGGDAKELNGGAAACRIKFFGTASVRKRQPEKSFVGSGKQNIPRNRVVDCMQPENPHVFAGLQPFHFDRLQAVSRQPQQSLLRTGENCAAGNFR